MSWSTAVNPTRGRAWTGGPALLVAVILALGGLGAVPATPARADTTASTAYVSNSTDKTIQPFDPDTGIAGTAISVGSTAATLLLSSPDGSTIYFSQSGSVKALNVATSTITQLLSVTTTSGLVLSPDGATLYVADTSSSGSVYAIDTATSTYAALVTGISTGGGLDITPDGTYLIVTGYSSSSGRPVTRVDIAAKTTTDLGLKSYLTYKVLVLNGETALLSSSSGGLYQLDLDTWQVTATLTTAATTNLSLASDGTKAVAYTSTTGAKKAVVVDVASLAVTTIDLPSTTTNVVAGRTGSTVLATVSPGSTSAGSVVVYDTTTGTAGTTIAVGVVPSRIVFASRVTAPFPVAKPAAKASDGLVRLTWSMPWSGWSPITAYEVTPWIDSVAQTPIRTSDASTSFTVSGLTNGTTYTFTVAAVNAIGTGASSPASSPVTPHELTAPGAPTGVVGAAGDHSVGLSWTAPADDGGSDITGYSITAYDNGVALDPVTTTGVATSYDYTGLTVGDTYTFTVSAINSVGTGPASSASDAAVPWEYTVPGAVTGLAATSGNASISLSWTAPTDTGHSAITGYTVEARSNGGSLLEQTVQATGTTATVTGLVNNRSYNLSVVATNVTGTGAASWVYGVIPYPDISVSEVVTTDSGDTWESANLAGVLGANDNPTGTLTVSQLDPSGNQVDPSDLKIAVTNSTNSAVATVNDVTVSGRGNARTVTVTPAGTPGRTTITLTVTGIYRTATTTFTYGVNGPANDEGTVENSKWLLGTTDMSTLQDVGDGYAITADDENNVLRLYDLSRNAAPVKTWDTQEAVTAVSGKTKEADYESSVRIGDVIYWLSSAGIGYKGVGVKPSDGDRQEVVATRVSGSGAATELSVLGAVTGLADALTTWNEAQGQPLGTLIGSPKAVSTALNIEGAVLAPDSTTEVWLAMRGPVDADGKAILLPMTNFTSWAPSDGSSQQAAVFGTPIRLDLDGLGIRDIARDDSGRYLIVAGPWAETGSQSLYSWTGATADEPVKIADLPSANSTVKYGAFEGIYAPDGFGDGAKIGLLQDNGTSLIYGDNNDGNAGNDSGKSLPVALKKDLIQTFTLDLADAAPQAPRAVVVDASARKARITWTPPSWDGDQTITSYTVTPIKDGEPQDPVVVDGTATSAQLALEPGSYTFTVAATNLLGTGPASEPSATAEVTKAASHVELTVATSDQAGRKFTLTAALPDDATGTVEFLDNGTTIQTSEVTAGTATTIVTGALAAGTHTLTARYSGDTNYFGVEGSQQILLAPSMQYASLSVATDSSTVAPDSDLAVTVTLPDSATGTVSLIDNYIPVGSRIITPGTPTAFTLNLAAGVHYLRAEYSGDSAFLPQASTVSVTSVKRSVTLTTPTLSASSQIYRATSGASVSVRVVGLSSGQVTFTAGSTVLGSAAISNGTATVALPTSLKAGRYTNIRAAVAGTDLTQAATSATAPAFTVNRATLTSITVTGSRFKAGTRPKITVRLGRLTSGALATGSIRIRVNGATKVIRTLRTTDQGRVTITLAKARKSIKVSAEYLSNDSSISRRTSKTTLVKVR